ncbi:hypothetical protein T484DRAFT_1752630 [Baffinella frigidus]|nr:hypothetical protein T484DRAFT_1756629 [Cryptophyta sp. CCMP2293]KAJ1472610.1 hypothetical protein T484DRAFT_1752630 [Cryptophyta sp. CCMP2293]
MLRPVPLVKPIPGLQENVGAGTPGEDFEDPSNEDPGFEHWEMAYATIRTRAPTTSTTDEMQRDLCARGMLVSLSPRHPFCFWCGHTRGRPAEDYGGDLAGPRPRPYAPDPAPAGVSCGSACVHAEPLELSGGPKARHSKGAGRGGAARRH